MRSTIRRWCVVLCMLACTTPALGQVQRTVVNLGFEAPDMGTNACYVIIEESQVPGWSSTHPTGATHNSGCNGITLSPTSGSLLELWANNVQGGAGGAEVVPAYAGTQHAELNARDNSRIYQDICLTNGESVSWRLAHRGLDSDTQPDVMDFGINPIGDSATPVVTRIARIGTTKNGADRIDLAGTPSFADQGTLVIGGSTSGWREYSGTFTWTGATGTQQVGFSAVSAVNGLTGGNHLDDIQLTLAPYIELVSTAATIREGTTPTVQIRVIGAVPAGGFDVPVSVTGGTADAADYTLGATIAIAAGEYDNQLIDIPITLVDDSVIEDNETLVVALAADPANYTLTSTLACGDPGNVSETITIVDNDVDVRSMLSVANANPPPSGTTTFTATFQNNTARPTFGSGSDLQAHDATVVVADAIPPGFSAFSWTCAASGTPAPVCPAPSGTGAINATATLPAGNGGAAGGVLTYTITATVAPGQCTASANTSTVTLSAPAQGTSAQAGFATPVPGGTANDSASATVDPGCITLTKVVTPAGIAGPFAFTLTSTGQASGSATTPAGGSVQVDGDVAAGTQPFGIVAPGTAVTITEDTIASGFYLTDAACTGPSGATGTLSGATLTLDAASVTAGADFTCTFNNAATGTITIVKDASPDDPQDFAFITTGAGLSNFSLDDDADATLTNTRTFTNLLPGAFSVEESLAPGWILSGLACTDPDGGTTTILATRTASIDVDSAETITCTFTNTSTVADLSITKTNTPLSGVDDQANDTLVHGQAVTYSIVVRNAGPAPATGAVVRDAMSGIDCPATNAVSCTSSACPGATVATLTGASGLVLPLLAAGDTVTLTFDCTVP